MMILYILLIYFLTVAVSFLGYAVSERIMKEYSPDAVSVSFIPFVNIVLLIAGIIILIGTTIKSQSSLNELYKRLCGYYSRKEKDGM